MKKLLTSALLIATISLAAQAQQSIATAQLALNSEAALVAGNFQPASADTCHYLDRIKGHYFLDGNPISRKEYKDFLKNNCPEAWQRYKSGTALWATGWSLFGVGVASTCIVAPALITTWFTSGFEIGEYYLWNTETAWEPGRKAGVIVFGVGLGLLTASAPCIAIGAVKRSTAHNTYNDHCAKQQEPPLELSLQTSQNGLGLALKF